jgi:hypothetical protein
MCGDLPANGIVPVAADVRRRSALPTGSSALSPRRLLGSAANDAAMDRTTQFSLIPALSLGGRRNVTTSEYATGTALRFRSEPHSLRHVCLWSCPSPAGASLSPGERAGVRAGVRAGLSGSRCKEAHSKMRNPEPGARSRLHLTTSAPYGHPPHPNPLPPLRRAERELLAAPINTSGDSLRFSSAPPRTWSTDRRSGGNLGQAANLPVNPERTSKLAARLTLVRP